MKNVTRIISILMLFALSFGASAQNYCMTAPEGWGAGTTGAGTGKTPAVVTSESAFVKAIKDGAFIIVKGAITITDEIEIKGIDNLTILGTNNATLNFSNKNSGIYIKDKSKNIIIRNLKFVGPGAVDVNGTDPLCVDESTNIWVDHCDFSDGIDGNFDIKNAADNITVTWCKFTYTSRSKDHEFSNLIGSSDGATGDAGKLRVTFQYCWWENVKERMPRVRFGKVHIVNCYYNSKVVGTGCITAGKDGNIRVENTYFDGVKNPLDGDKFSGASVINALNNYYTGCKASGKGYAKDGKYGSGTPFTPSYTLTTLLPAQDVKDAVTKANCGAGATLQVTEAGVVSSSCGSGIPPVTPLAAPATVDAQSTSNSVTVRWSAVNNATGYKVRLCENGSSSVSKEWDFAGNWGITAASADANLVADATAGRFNYNPAANNAELKFANGTTIPFLAGLKFTAGGGTKLRLGYGTGLLYLNGNGITLSIPCKDGDVVIVEAVHASTDASKGNRGFSVVGGTFDETLSSANVENGTVGYGQTGTWVYNATGSAVELTVTGDGGMNIKKIIVGSSAGCNEIEVGTVTSYTFNSLTSDQTYSYQVQALGNDTEYSDSPFSAAETVTTAVANSINDNNVEASKFVVYQSNDNLVVKGDDVQSLAVYSLVGTTIAKNEHQNEINLSGVPSGVYIVNINNGAVKKFIWK